MAYSDETNVNLAKEEYENRNIGDSLRTNPGNEYVGILSDAKNKFILILKQVEVMKLCLQMLHLVKEKRLRK